MKCKKITPLSQRRAIDVSSVKWTRGFLFLPLNLWGLEAQKPTHGFLMDLKGSNHPVPGDQTSQEVCKLGSPSSATGGGGEQSHKLVLVRGVSLRGLRNSC